MYFRVCSCAIFSKAKTVLHYPPQIFLWKVISANFLCTFFRILELYCILILYSLLYILFLFQLSQQYGLNQVVCNDIMTGHAPTSLPTVGPSGSSRSFLTLQGQSGPGHVTLNPYHYYHHQEAEDLHDGLAATLHLRDSVYMSPHLVRLTNTLRSKKKMMCQVCKY